MKLPSSWAQLRSIEPPLRTYETGQPWVIYEFGAFHDRWWPPLNSTRWRGHTVVAATCVICGVREDLQFRMPRFGKIADPNLPHPLRTQFLARHRHGSAPLCSCGDSSVVGCAMHRPAGS